MVNAFYSHTPAPRKTHAFKSMYIIIKINSALPHVFAQLEQTIPHISPCNRADTTFGIRDPLAETQLNQRLQFVICKFLSVLFLFRFLRFLQYGLGTFHEEVVVVCSSREIGVWLNVLEILLQDEDVELHPAAAVGIHRRNHAGVSDEVCVDKKSETSTDKAYFLITKEVARCFLVRDKISIDI